MRLPAEEEMVRRDAWLKVTGRAKFNDDTVSPSCLQARLLTSTFAHAEIASIDVREAYEVPGVRAVVTGADVGVLTGPILQDMPVLATGVTRYFGEPIAIVVANEEWQAALAAKQIKVEYRSLSAVNSIEDALSPNAPIIHPELGNYRRRHQEIYPEAGTNIANRTRIRKGSMPDGWRKSEVIIEAEYRIPQANHVYMETRNARAEIRPDGTVRIRSATQAPHSVRKLIAECFSLNENSVIVETPFVGGGYGGKVNPHVEMMAYIASRAVGGQEVRLSLTREECFLSSACKIGARAFIKLGADKNGRIQALQAEYLIEAGAYADTAPIMARAVAANCSGAYDIPNIHCDSVCVYTNHIYTTSFRGFGHGVSTFAIERTLEKLAEKIGRDPVEIRLINDLREGGYLPTQVKVTAGNTGNLEACIRKVREIIEWDKGARLQVDDRHIKAKGLACFSKTSSSPTDASSSATVTFCSDGSAILNCGVVECGPGMSTALPLILAKKLKISPDRVRINMEIDTQANPEHWKTVASMSSYMAGNAILAAADDAIRQLKRNAALALNCEISDVELGEDVVYLISDPSISLKLKDVVIGVKDANGSAIGGPVTGCGHFTMRRLSYMDRETGKGRTGPYWTVGAQAVEIEYDRIEHTFRLVRAVAVLDVGKVIHPACAVGQVMGAMCMGLGIATREENHYDPGGEMKDSSLRTYKVMHYGENPEYHVEFIETPNPGAPYGLRGLAEHGILGMPAALANALCRAAEIQLDSLPITFESLWQAVNQKNLNRECVIKDDCL